MQLMNIVIYYCANINIDFNKLHNLLILTTTVNSSPCLDQKGDHFRQHIRVLLQRDVSEPSRGFGFGVSDGCQKNPGGDLRRPQNDLKGVYVSALKVNGSADAAGLRRYDQILKVALKLHSQIQFTRFIMRFF